MAPEQHQSLRAKEPPATAELRQTPLPDLDSLLHAVDRDKGDPGMRIPWPLSRACRCRNGLCWLVGRAGAHRAPQPRISSPPPWHSLSKSIRNPLTQLERHEVRWSIPCHGHSTSPSTPGLHLPSDRSFWPSGICPSAPSKSLRLVLAGVMEKF